MFEMVVALAVVTTVLIVLAALTSLSIRNTTFSKNKTLSTRLTQEAVEWLRGERDASWSVFSTNAAIPTYCLTSLSWTQAKIGNCAAGDEVDGTIFLREVDFVIVDPNTVQADIQINWTDSRGGHGVNSSTFFTNWRAQ